MSVAPTTLHTRVCQAAGVPSIIQLVGGSSIMVEEDVEAVVQWLDKETAVFVRLTRMSMHDEPATLDGQPVYIRTAQVASVSPTG